MTGIFRLIATAPLVVPMRSRDGFTYMYRLIRFVGWLPPEAGAGRWAYFLWRTFVFVSAILYVPLGLCLSLTFDIEKLATERVIGTIQIMLNGCGISIKSLIMMFLFSRLQETRTVLEALDEHVGVDDDRRKIHKAVADGNYVSLVYGISYVGYTTSMLFAALISREPPWFYYNPLFDWTDGAVECFAQTLLEYVVLTLAVCLNLILDTCPIIFMLICRAHVDILKEHIRKLRSDALKREAEHYDELVNCIKYHQLILKSCNLMRQLMARIVCIQFMLIGAVLGLSMVAIIYSSDISFRITSVILVVALLLETFPFCYLCDSLANDCNELSNALAQSRWIDAEKRYKSTLKIFLFHVQQPIIFNGFGIIQISVNSNIKVAKFAFSVLTVVKRMNLFDQFD